MSMFAAQTFTTIRKRGDALSPIRRWSRRRSRNRCVSNTSAQRFKARGHAGYRAAWPDDPRRRQGPRSLLAREIATAANFPIRTRSISTAVRKDIWGSAQASTFCLGSQMARLVTEVAMRRSSSAVPDYHLNRRQGRLELVVELPQSDRAARSRAADDYWRGGSNSSARSWCAS